MINRESHLVKALVDHLNSEHCPFSSNLVGFEFDYLAGRIDVVATNTDGELISFEAKLDRWREALYQAYRNTSFCHFSYVVLPESTVQRALKGRIEFERRGVGLCSVGASGIRIEILASKREPLQPWLTRNAIAHAAACTN